MSTSAIGRIGIGLIGAGIAASTGGDPRTGFQAGIVVGGFLFPERPNLDNGKLSDLRLSGSSFGSPWPRIWGSGRVGGQVIWARRVNAAGDHLRGEKRSAGKKGGGSEWVYFTTFAVGFCQGAIFFPDPSIDPGRGTFGYRNHWIKRIWFNDEVVYQASGPSTVTLNKYGATIRRGAEDQAVVSIIAGSEGLSGNTPAFRGTVYAVFEDLNLRTYGNTIPQISAEIVTDAVSAADVLGDLCRSVGLKASEIDVTAVTSISVTGFVWSTREPVRNAIEQLCRVYDVDIVEVDGVLRFIPRGSGSIFPISDDWLGTAEDGAKGIRISRKRLRKDDLPARVTVQYFDASSLYQVGSMSDWRQTEGNVSDQSIPTGFVLTGDEALKIAKREIDRAWSENEELNLTLPMAALQLAPGDRISVNVRPSRSVTARITSMKLAPIGAVSVTAVIEDSDVSIQVVSGSTGNAAPKEYPVVPSAFDCWSEREVIDAHSSTAGFYVAATGETGWSGAQVWYLPPGATEYIEGPFISGRGVFGEATSTLSNSGASVGARDLTNTVGVDLSDSEGELETIEDVAVDGGQNWAWIGDEIVGFSTATLTGANQYTLSRLLRGIRLSSLPTHSSGERFALANSSVARIQVPDAHVGETYQVKCVSPGQTLADVTAKSVVIIARTPTTTEATVSGLLRPHFVTPADVSLTLDDTWRSASAPGSVPANAQLLIVMVEWENTSGSATRKTLEVRSGPSGTAYAVVSSTSVATADLSSGSAQVLLPVGDSFEYKAPSGWTLRVTVQGYWAPES